MLYSAPANRYQWRMLHYVLRRLAYGLLTVWFIATATFVGMHAVPGDPLLDARAVSPEIRRNLEERYGLGQPLPLQYLRFLTNMLRGDFGVSFTESNREVNDILREHFPVSALLGLLALAFAALGGLGAGIVGALYPGRWPDTAIQVLVALGISVPGFVVAALAQLAILRMNAWTGTRLPVAGWGSISQMLVPAAVLGLATMAFLARLLRAELLETGTADYVRTARAKGLTPGRILLRHRLPNAVLPAITVLGPAIAAITTGGFVVELVFAIPGLGRYFVQAVQQLDYTVIMGTTVFYGAFLVLMVVMVDIIHGLLDPRVRSARTRQ